ncbi:MAG TPA: hypothetical protein PK640_05085 [Verrucomicrobiota bacterium]|nr:hypothetical protein [Verrucomicrobiota bacterium]
MAGFALFGVVPGALAQGDAVTLRAAEFQRQVYSAHLLTQLDEKPELDASLQVLLELHRRNPDANPTDLAALLRETTARYRTNAPAYVRTNGFRDEVLAAYLDSLLEVPARTNLVQANLALLSYFMLKPDDYARASAAQLIHGGNQSLLTAETTISQREELVDLCTQRGSANPTFGLALDSLFGPEVGVLRTFTPLQILTVNSVLSNTPTMQMMLDRSGRSGDGSVTLSTNELKSLFSQEMGTMREIINTNLATGLTILESQTDLPSYLANTNLVQANQDLENAARRGQPQRLAAASAAVNQVSRMTASVLPVVGQTMGGLGRGVKGIADGLKALKESGKLMKAAACGNFVAGGLQIVGTCLDLAGVFQDPNDVVLQEIGQVKDMIQDLSDNMNYRFDLVDRSLDQVLDRVSYSINLIGEVGHDVDQVRQGLVDAQTDLHRLERHLGDYVKQLYTRNLNLAFNTWLNYEQTHLGQTMSAADYTRNAEPIYFTQAQDNSVDGLGSPYSGRDYTPSGLYWELTESGNGLTNRLDQNLGYVKEYLNDELGQETEGSLGQLANPRDWFVGAHAYLQLAQENPKYYRQEVDPVYRLDLITARGQGLASFLRSLTLKGTNINWALYDALLTNYAGRLNAFVTQMHATEQDYANLHLDQFAVDTWRRWAAHAPLVTTSATAVTPVPLYAQDVTRVVAGGMHSLGLRADGTVIGWGSNGSGQIDIPSSATNVIAIAAGSFHSLALKADGTVIGWGAGGPGMSGDLNFDQTVIPSSATNVIAIAAGHYHSLALRADGSIVGWGAGRPGTSGFPHFTQATVPEDATKILRIAAGGYHSVAVRQDGTLLAWGLNNEGQLDIPLNATNIIDVAAGHGHNLAVQFHRDGHRLIAWGNNRFNGVDVGITNVPTEATNIAAIAAGGWHCLAKRQDGAILAWGYNGNGQTNTPTGLPKMATIAAGDSHNLATKYDGTVVGWGDNSDSQSTPPGSPPGGAAALSASGWRSLALRADGTVVGWGADDNGIAEGAWAGSNVVAVAVGYDHSLALRADGRVVAWGTGFYGQNAVPDRATNVVAIDDGLEHSLALRADGRVIGWGRNTSGLLGIPDEATNVVAIAAGVGHNLALRADGTVLAWGSNSSGQTTIPTSATNVTAVAAKGHHSLALRADGTVVAWGWNSDGQTNVPPKLSNVVAVASGFAHSLALRADGTVVAWGVNHHGETNVPPSATNVVAIAAGGYNVPPIRVGHSLALRADGTVVAWGLNDSGQTNVPISLTRYESQSSFTASADPRTATDLTKVAAGLDYSLGLRADGTVLAWGVNNFGQCSVPTGLSGAVDIAAGHRHGLALTTSGGVVAWGWNVYGQTNVPSPALNHVETIAAGGTHSLALRNDGMVVAWGCNNAGQCTVPDTVSNIVAIAAGAQHSLALRGDSTVVAWGAANAGGVPFGLANVVAIAAGDWHSLALLGTGEVAAWGADAHGQTDVPVEAQSGVVAIAAFRNHSLALKTDGSVVAWGENVSGQTDFPVGLSNVVALAAGGRHNVFLTAQSGGSGSGGLEFVLAHFSPRITRQYLHAATTELLSELGEAGPLNPGALEFAGSKALLQAVLELGLPYTMERDDVLHGMFYGAEPLADLAVARDLFSAEADKLATTPDARPMIFEEVAGPRVLAFANRLNERLHDLQATGQPEIPRIVGHTLRLLNLLRDAWASVPPPALGNSQATSPLRLVVYGEPNTRYTLQYRDSLSVVDWTTSTITNWRDGQVVIPPTSDDPQRFYRALLPWP